MSLGSYSLRLIASAALVASTVAIGGAQAAPALTASELAAVREFTNAINNLGPDAMGPELSRLAKQYSDQGLNLSGIVAKAKAAAGNKLGAVNRALAQGCAGAAAGSKDAQAICAAATVVAEGDTGQPTTEFGALAGGGGGAGGAGGGGGGLPGLGGGGAGGTGTGNGTGGASNGNNGQQSTGNVGGPAGRNGSVGSNVPTSVIATAGNSVSPAR